MRGYNKIGSAFGKAFASDLENRANEARLSESEKLALVKFSGGSVFAPALYSPIIVFIVFNVYRLFSEKNIGGPQFLLLVAINVLLMFLPILTSRFIGLLFIKNKNPYIFTIALILLYLFFLSIDFYLGYRVAVHGYPLF